MSADGGVKRVRITGTRAAGTGTPGILTNASSGRNDMLTPQPPMPTPNDPLASELPPPLDAPSIPALPITTEAFKAYGSVIQAWADPDAVSRGTRVTSANQGTAHKFHNLALVEQSYPPDAHARTGMSVYRATHLFERTKRPNQGIIGV